MKTENWIHGWLKSIWKKKEYPYNIEFGDGRTKKEMDKMQKELMECGCLPDCGCKETKKDKLKGGLA
jgi:hypothetical protein|tara:strand:+ start:231 stop:431 length:201 start_codon:yes stop_codon:yes gene_type:complete